MSADTEFLGDPTSPDDEPQGVWPGRTHDIEKIGRRSGFPRERKGQTLQNQSMRFGYVRIGGTTTMRLFTSSRAVKLGLGPSHGTPATITRQNFCNEIRFRPNKG